MKAKKRIRRREAKITNADQRQVEAQKWKRHVVEQKRTPDEQAQTPEPEEPKQERREPKQQRYGKNDPQKKK